MIEQLVTWFVAGSVADPSLSDVIAGDLLEDYALVAQSRGRVAGAAWLARQFLASLPHFVSFAPRCCSVDFFTLRAIRRFYTSIALLVVLSALLVQAFDWAARRVTSPSQLLVAFGLSIVASGLAGFGAARIVTRLGLVAALAVGLSSLAIALGALLAHEVQSSPVFWFAVLVAVIPATVAGGLARARQLSRAPSSAQEA